jgi:mono/diheme cytochrome c family protein
MIRLLPPGLMAALVLICLPLGVTAQDAPDPKRGEYLVQATGGCGCHTDYKHKGAKLAGGRPIKTPFGLAYASNITPDRNTGLGVWSEEDFVRAMTQGVGLHGKELFPVFPYTSFTRIERRDLRDLWAYLRTVPPVDQPSKEQGFAPPFSFRFGVKVWKALNFKPEAFRPDPAQPEAWNRGAYLVTALGHCAECHTPRNPMGALKSDMTYAGSVDGPEGEFAPNITPDSATGIGKWSTADIVYYLQTGLDPQGDSAQGLMGELIENGYSKLTEQDLQAVATYLKALKPIYHRREKRKT